MFKHSLQRDGKLASISYSGFLFLVLVLDDGDDRSISVFWDVALQKTDPKSKSLPCVDSGYFFSFAVNSIRHQTFAQTFENHRFQNRGAHFCAISGQ